VGWVLALDSLNFCFWSAAPDPNDRWRVEWGGVAHDGYWALVAALRRGIDEGFELWNPAALANLSDADVARLLRPSQPGTTTIPLLAERAANLRELGRGLLIFSAEPDAAARFVASAGRSAPRLAELVAGRFPSFNDVAMLDGREVRFFKRAQILVADLHGAFSANGLGRFDDLSALTAFADYKVPQVLRGLGALRYKTELAAAIDRRELIPAGSRQEIEIRAATIWACEWLRQAVAGRGRTMAAFEIDWALWMAGQSLGAEVALYHRTQTIFY
jgi:Potential Queuosine, Q, salvage protein family